MLTYQAANLPAISAAAPVIPVTKASGIKKPLTVLAALSVPFFHSVTSKYNSSVRTILVYSPSFLIIGHTPSHHAQ